MARSSRHWPAPAPMKGDGEVFILTPVLSTSAYTAGDVLFEFVEVPNFVRENGDVAIVKSVSVIDKANQGAAFDLVIASQQAALGTVNAAPAITAAQLVSWNVLPLVKIEAADYIAVASTGKLAVKECFPLIRAEDGTRSMWIAGIARGTPTYAADSLAIHVGVRWK